MIEKIDILGNYSPSGYESSRVVSRGSISPTVKENHGTTTGIVDMDNSDTGYRIRKLTPKECWRLMGFSDEAFEKAKAAGVSNSQLYKQAGNSIVTDVLYHIFKELYVAMPYLFNNLKVGSYFSGIGAFEVGLSRLFNDINNSSMQTYFAPSGGKK